MRLDYSWTYKRTYDVMPLLRAIILPQASNEKVYPPDHYYTIGERKLSSTPKQYLKEYETGKWHGKVSVQSKIKEWTEQGTVTN